MLSEEQLRGIQARCERIPQGMWQVDAVRIHTKQTLAGGIEVGYEMGVFIRLDPEALTDAARLPALDLLGRQLSRLFAGAPADIPALLAEIDRLRAEVEALRKMQVVILREAGALMEMWCSDWSGMDFDGRDTLRAFGSLRKWAEDGGNVGFTECTDWQKRLDDER